MNLTELLNAQKAGTTSISKCTCKGIYARGQYLILQLSEVITLTNVGGHHLNHKGPEWNKRAKEGQILSLFETECPSALVHWTSELQGLWMSGPTSAAPWFSGL